MIMQSYWLSAATTLALVSACATITPDNSTSSQNVIELLTNKDMAIADQAVQQALETHTSGVTLTWRNIDNGHAGSITPIRTYKTKSGYFCRVYTEAVNVAGTTRRYQETACRDRDGVWKLAKG